MEGVVDAVIDRLGDQRVAVVRLEVGRLAGVEIEAMRFSFDVCVQGTSLADAELDIVEIAAVARCRACGAEQATRAFATPCDCGSFDRELVRGGELRLVEVEVF
jgi:hydrogenase nickel incorporation protein HypA/HybF